MDAVTGLICLGVLVGVFVIIFIVCRQFTLWYFRVNEIADTLHKIETHLRPSDYTEPKLPKREVPRWNP